ncbi:MULTISPECIES: spore germination protein [unclassified Paenibacillus]|uniref:spore germination protein n=1 Tax=unclassified Paenibacillus TaxID=185978 RepID=UPI0024055EE2|nr:MULTISPECIES: spore germination protein [unclassified Paenibacillus]MDF9844368.1 spore germination protein [Paenibacillus sp. PastF-2]MDF9850972.1 spore germination protein [Paenibacillus sp. PastM-2]MDF9857543.1 spore germination protein [Paenibacillus sp. PastF-1]MDH6482816.1 spore germination protein [Paenibacillus sp. PastH-2]MDH6510241.1 spore germination protein [Paenibacillus sp. PastM-3]
MRLNKRSKDPFAKKINALEPEIDSNISDRLEDNRNCITQVFENCSDLVVRKLLIFGSMPAIAVYLDVLIDKQLWDDGFLEPIMQESEPPVSDLSRLHEQLTAGLSSIVQPSVVLTMKEAAGRIVTGETLLFIEGSSQAFSYSIKDTLNRALDEPSTEAVIRGPRYGFIEKMDINLALIRHRLRTPRLKTEKLSAGSLSRTNVTIVYIEDIAQKSVVEEVKKRIADINMDSILESGYIEELISDHPYSPFPVIQATQRPDMTTGSLIEGKVAVITDGSPMVLILPVTFWFGFQSAEDYYMKFMFATMLRWLRYLFAFFAMALPSIFIAVTTFHQEMIPTSLTLSLAAAREVVPFPAIVEALIMEITFEALREAGIRLPRPVGQTISIVGALVIGQAAVQAGIISATIIIVVSITGISSFLIPNPGMSQAISIIRFPLMLLAATFGLYGVGIGLIVILVHLVNLRSFGVPYMSPLAPVKMTGLADSLWRAPWQILRKRHKHTRH